MCVVLTEKEKEKENKSGSDRPKREKREWIVWWVVGLGGEHVGTNNLIYIYIYIYIFFFFLTDGTLHNNHKQMSNVGLKIELN